MGEHQRFFKRFDIALRARSHVPEKTSDTPVIGIGHSMGIGQINLPCVAVRAKPSVFFTEALWQEWQQRSPGTVFMEDLSAGHLLPLEDPEGCRRLIVAGLAKIL